MIRKPFAAFGRVLYANYYDKGDVVEVRMNADSRIVLYFSEGSFTAKNKTNGMLELQCDPGWFAYGNHQNRTLLCTANDPTVCWCYDPEVNQGYVPGIKPFELLPGQTLTVPVGTNLFLCKGTLLVNQMQHMGPYQIAVRTSEATLTAVTDIYGLLFE